MAPGKGKQVYEPMLEFDEEIGDGEDWQLIDAVEKHSSDEEYHEYPKEHFTGTWEGAMANTKETVKEVKAATQSFYGAVSKSGLGKTGFAIGSALANTASRGALSGISLAVAASGVPEHQLPGPVKGWLKKKEDIDHAKARAENAERARLHRKLKIEIAKDIAEGREPFAKSSRRGSWMSSEGDSLSDIPVKGFLQQNRRSGLIDRNYSRRGSSTRSISATRLSADFSKFRMGGYKDEVDGGYLRDKKGGRNPRIQSSKSNTPGTRSPLTSSKRATHLNDVFDPAPVKGDSSTSLVVSTPSASSRPIPILAAIKTPSLVRCELKSFPMPHSSADGDVGEDSPYSSHGLGPYFSRAYPSRHPSPTSKLTKSPAADSGFGPSPPPSAELPEKAVSTAIMVEYTLESDRYPPAAETEEESSENVFAPRNRLVRTPPRTVPKDEEIKEEKDVDEKNVFAPRHCLSPTPVKSIRNEDAESPEQGVGLIKMDGEEDCQGDGDLRAEESVFSAS